MGKVKKVRTLRDAKTTAQICALERNNWAYGDFWIVSDGSNVKIVHEPIGAPVDAITLPRHVFNRLIDFYQKEQAP